MICSYVRSIQIASLAQLSIVLLVATCCGQLIGPQPSELKQRLGRLVNAGNSEEAIAIIKMRAAEPDPAPEIAEAAFKLAQLLFGQQKYAESLDLLKKITERFPQAPTASLAWCGMGQVYAKLGDSANMIIALERAMMAPGVWTETNIMDASDTRNYAFEVLGEHYIQTRQWKQACEVFTAWRPRSWCGTCADGMNAYRINNILLCHAHLAQFRDLTDLVWHELAGLRPSSTQIEMFLLVRSYFEAGQLDDLRSMIARCEENAAAKLPRNASSTNEILLRAIRKMTATLLSAIESAKQKDPFIHIDTLEAEDATPVSKHIARWSLIHNPKQSVPAIKSAALKPRSRSSDLFQVLAAIDTLGSRTVLVDLASNRNTSRRQAAYAAIRNMKERKELLAKVIGRVPDRSKTEFDVNAEFEPLPRNYQYYESWTNPRPKSLPKSLPANLFEEKDIR